MEPGKAITISSIMREFGLSQEEFALLFNCARKQVSEWINGKVHPGKLRRDAILARYELIKKHPELVGVAREEARRRRKLMTSSLEI
jgi:DNA-binding transcriptional regulator YiaG